MTAKKASSTVADAADAAEVATTQVASRRRHLLRAIDKLEGELLSVSRESTRDEKEHKLVELREALAALPPPDDSAADVDDIKQSELLVRLVADHFEVFEPTGEGGSAAMAVERGGPNVAIRLKGDSRSLRQRLASMYRSEYGTPPSQTALAEAMMVIEGDVIGTEPRRVHRRVARLPDRSIVLDLGDDKGRCVQIRAAGWEVLERSPVTFIRDRRLTLALPTPRRRGSLKGLRSLVNVSDDDWRLCVAWVVHALIPDEAHTILAGRGEHGAAKTAGVEALLWTIDRSDGTTRSAPKHDKDWAVASGASWTFVIDNLSWIEPWLSDLLCKAVTGEAHVYRTLFTDSDANVIQVQRAFAITTIGTNPLRGDLADRMLPINFPYIPDNRRRTDAEVAGAFERCHASALGAVLDLLAGVLGLLPEMIVDRPTRMADFCAVTQAVGHLMTPDKPTSILDHYKTLHGEEMDDVIEADPVGQAVIDMLKHRGGAWSGTATQLLSELNMVTSQSGREGWPRTANRLSGLLNRLVPSLRRRGIDVVFDRQPTIKTISFTTRSETRGKGSSSSSSSSSPDGPANGHEHDDDDDHDDGSHLVSDADAEPFSEPSSNGDVPVRRLVRKARP